MKIVIPVLKNFQGIYERSERYVLGSELYTVDKNDVLAKSFVNVVIAR